MPENDVIKHRCVSVLCLYLSSRCLPECGDAGEAGSMTAVPSSAIWSWRTRLGCTAERGGERAPLSFPLARLGSFRSRGSSRDSMTQTRSPPNCENRWGKFCYMVWSEMTIVAGIISKYAPEPSIWCLLFFFFFLNSKLPPAVISLVSGSIFLLQRKLVNPH